MAYQCDTCGQTYESGQHACVYAFSESSGLSSQEKGALAVHRLAERAGDALAPLAVERARVLRAARLLAREGARFDLHGAADALGRLLGALTEHDEAALRLTGEHAAECACKGCLKVVRHGG